MSGTEFKIDFAVDTDLSGQRGPQGGRTFAVNYLAQTVSPTMAGIMEGHAALTALLNPGGVVEQHYLSWSPNMRKCITAGLDAAIFSISGTKVPHQEERDKAIAILYLGDLKQWLTSMDDADNKPAPTDEPRSIPRFPEESARGAYAYISSQLKGISVPVKEAPIVKPQERLRHQQGEENICNPDDTPPEALEAASAAAKYMLTISSLNRQSGARGIDITRSMTSELADLFNTASGMLGSKIDRFTDQERVRRLMTNLDACADSLRAGGVVTFGNMLKELDLHAEALRKMPRSDTEA